MTYRFQYTMVLSFMHRVTGCALSVGQLLFVCWLISAAGGEDSYARLQGVFAHPLMKLVLVGFSYAFFYHLLNGFRHLVWDTGRGFEKRTARISGWSVFIAAVTVTICFWALLCLGGGAA
ncbi:succinate dehydrogenase, cytochrome b556 subunit [Steroidobacter denitrificans]|nr:succinate dehydrogenase, cytochrome b556 subunit [Steroidobacter denitrificans]